MLFFRSSLAKVSFTASGFRISHLIDNCLSLAVADCIVVSVFPSFLSCHAKFIISENKAGLFSFESGLGKPAYSPKCDLQVSTSYPANVYSLGSQ